jgi:hypothetical protein
MRRLIASIAVIVLVASATVGYATRLDLAPTALSAGTGTVAPCDPDGIRIDYRLAWKGHVAIDRVQVTGIADRCVGHRLAAVIVVAGRPIDLEPVTVTFSRSEDNTASVVVSEDIWATAAESVHVSIT